MASSSSKVVPSLCSAPRRRSPKFSMRGQLVTAGMMSRIWWSNAASFCTETARVGGYQQAMSSSSGRNGGENTPYSKTSMHDGTGNPRNSAPESAWPMPGRGHFGQPSARGDYNNEQKAVPIFDPIDGSRTKHHRINSHGHDFDRA